MNLSRVALASVGAFVVYLAVGGLAVGLLPWLKNEFLKYPNVYRSQEGIKSAMPLGMAFMLVAIGLLVVLYAFACQGGSEVVEGARFGVLIGIFAVGSFELYNYVSLQIGAKLAVQQALAYFIE